MNFYLPILELITVAAVLGIPHSSSEHSKYSHKKIDKFGTRSETDADGDNLYKKEWDSYWESYYRNLMNKLNTHSYRGKMVTSTKTFDNTYHLKFDYL